MSYSFQNENTLSPESERGILRLLLHVKGIHVLHVALFGSAVGSNRLARPGQEKGGVSLYLTCLRQVTISVGEICTLPGCHNNKKKDKESDHELV